MSNRTVERAHLVDALQTCPTHERPAAFVVAGRVSTYVACDAPGCRQDVESAHRMENGAGYMPTIRYEVVETLAVGTAETGADVPHVGHFSRLGGTWWCDTCDSPYCDRA